MATRSFSELVERGYQRWYQFGGRSPKVLYGRLRHKYRPIFKLRMMQQRVSRGFSDADAWSLDYFLASVIVGGVGKLREWAHGYPMGLSPKEWDDILRRIQEGFQAWLDTEGWFNEEESSGRAKFDEAVTLLGKWFGALWD